MKKSLKIAAAAAGAAALVLSGTAVATAQSAGATVCAGGWITSGSYPGLKITGSCKVHAGAKVVVNGNLVVKAGAKFDAQTDSQVIVNGDAIAGPGSFFGLGCTFAHPCDNGNPPRDGMTHDYVKGSIKLNGVFDAAINGNTVGASIISNGGGAGLDTPNFVPFSIKDNVVDGSIYVSNLNTVWFGIIRTQVGRSVVLNNINLSDPDGNEIVTNHINGNLSCTGLSPAPQVGDSEGELNFVGKVASGQCADLAGGGAL